MPVQTWEDYGEVKSTPLYDVMMLQLLHQITRRIIDERYLSSNDRMLWPV